MVSNQDLIALAVLLGVALYLKKKADAAASAATDLAHKVAATVGDAWESAATYAQGVAQDAPLFAAVTAPDYPAYLSQQNTARDTMAAQYGPTIQPGTGWSATGYANPVNDAANSAYQSVTGSTGTIGGDLYDWWHK